MKASLFMKENDVDILTFNETWLKIKFKSDMPIYNITRNDRPRRWGVGAAIFVRNDTKFDIIGTCSTINTDNEAITILLTKLHSTSISTIYILPASIISATLLSNDLSA